MWHVWHGIGESLGALSRFARSIYSIRAKHEPVSASQIVQLAPHASMVKSVSVVPCLDDLPESIAIGKLRKKSAHVLVML